MKSDLSVAGWLFAVAALVYLLLFAGLPVSTDEMALFSGAQSFSQRAHLSATPLYWNQHGTVVFGAAGHAYPSFEPAQMVLAAPFHWLARQINGIGLLHAVWLFNVFVTAASAALLYLIGRRLHYSISASLTLGLLFAFTSIALPYARTFFREPLSALALLLATYGALGIACRAPSGKVRNTFWLASGLGVAYGVKLSNLVAWPLIFLLAVGSLFVKPAPARKETITGLLRLAIALLIALSFVWLTQMSERWLDRGTLTATLTRNVTTLAPDPTQIDWALVRHGLWGLWLSPGKSVFLYSPLALVALLAWPQFWREQRWLALMVAGLLVIFTLGYTLTKGDLWFGGLNWGPRFLVPITPFLLLPLLPWLEMAWLSIGTRRSVRWLLRIALAIMTLLGVIVQALAVLTPLALYSERLYQVRPNAMWTLAIEEWRYTPFFYNWQLIDFHTLDFLWARFLPVGGEIDWWPLAIGLGLLLALLWQTPSGKVESRAALYLLAPLLLSVVLLRNSSDDPRLPGGADRQALAAALNQLARPTDAILLSDATQVNFYLNTLRTPATLFAIDRQQGTLAAREQALFVALAEEYSRVWLISADAPATQPLPRQNSRPDEAWWMNVPWARLSEQQFSPHARLSLFVQPNQPLTSNPLTATFVDSTDLTIDKIGATIQLMGERRWQGDEWLYLETQWQALRQPRRDYTIFMQMIDATGALVWQSDQQPQLGFAPTSGWQPGVVIHHQVAVPLAGLAAGSYRLILGLYFFNDAGTLERLQVATGGDFVELLAVVK